MIDPRRFELDNAKQELLNPKTTPERVQEIYKRWIGLRGGVVVSSRYKQDEVQDNGIIALVMYEVYRVPIVLTVREGDVGEKKVIREELLFPKGKLTEEQRNQLESFSDCDKKADEYILWGAGRAAAIAISPIPLSDTAPLVANEGYMIYRLAETYGCKIDKSVVTMLLGVAGGSFAGMLLSSFLPGLKIAVAAGVTYAVGKMSKAYFASGMTLGNDELHNVFTSARKEADTIDWKSRKVEDGESPVK